MHRHLVTSAELVADTCVLEKEQARHLQTVLRMRAGDRVQLFDGCGATRVVEVADASTKNQLVLRAVEPAVTAARPATAVTLFVCVSKGKRMDWTVEKAVELGVARIVPVISDRTIVRLDREEGDLKVERWLRVAEEAARQSSAIWLPEISVPQTVADALTLVRGCCPTFVAALTPDAVPLRTALGHYAAPQQAGWFVGPEGDFTPDELQRVIDAGAIPVSLGAQVLRAETACIYGLCALNCAWL